MSTSTGHTGHFYGFSSVADTGTPGHELRDVWHPYFTPTLRCAARAWSVYLTIERPSRNDNPVFKKSNRFKDIENRRVSDHMPFGATNRLHLFTDTVEHEQKHTFSTRFVLLPRFTLAGESRQLIVFKCRNSLRHFDDTRNS